jgi:cytochrome b
MPGFQAFFQRHVASLSIGDTLIGLVTLHAIAAIVMGRLERTKLIKAMVTGVKERW